MPELPEVETVRRGLEPVLEHGRIAHVTARRPDLRFPLPDDFKARLEGAVIEGLQRRAKYLLARLDTGETLVMHLGMTGRFDIEGAGGGAGAPGLFAHEPSKDAKHAHVVFDMEGGARITYSDPRRFGFMGLIPTAHLAEHPWFKGMGPEPLGPDFNAGVLGQALRGPLSGDQDPAAGSAHRRRPGQYLCVRGPASRPHLADQGRRQGFQAQAGAPGRDDPGGSRRGHRSRRVHPAGFRGRRWGPGLFPAPVSGLWPRA